MKNLICPISNDKVSEYVPRITAFFIIALYTAYIITGFLPILIFLSFDFLVRGFSLPKFSLLNKLAIQLGITFKLNSPLIDKAPKLFAARLGGIMSIIALVLHLINIPVASVSISLLVVSLSALECIAGFCVGCYIYSLLILPVFKGK